MAKKTKEVEEPKEEASSDGSIAVNDAWTGMLAVSFLALAIGSGFLFYDYYFNYNAETEPPKVSKFIATPPGAAPAPVKGPQPKVEKDGAAKEKDAADKDKKDADKDK